MKRRLLGAAVFAVMAAGTVIGIGAATAHADPYGGPGQCQYLGTNYNVYYPSAQYQPWLPYGTANNPPLGAMPPGSCTDPFNAHNMACS